MLRLLTITHAWKAYTDALQALSIPLTSYLIIIVLLNKVCVFFGRSGDILVWRLVQPPPGPAESPQQSHQECGQDWAQLISFCSGCDHVFVTCKMNPSSSSTHLSFDPGPAQKVLAVKSLYSCCSNLLRGHLGCYRYFMKNLNHEIRLLDR